MKRAVLYMRVSGLDQHPETQLHDLRQMAAQRGYEIVEEYTDRISGAKARRPGLDELKASTRSDRSSLPCKGVRKPCLNTEITCRSSTVGFF